MTKLVDRTGSVPRVVGLVGMVLLVVTVLVLPEQEPEVPSEPVEAEAVASPLPPEADLSDPARLRETSRVRRLVPVYPGATFTPMGLLEANGNMMEMGFFEARASVREVMDFYTKEFGKRGRKVIEQPAANGGGTVNYYDETLGSLVAITATPKGGKGEPRTFVFPSVTATPDGIFLKPTALERLPQPEGLMTVMRVDDHTKGPTEGSTTLTQVARGSPVSLATFYRQEMTARGYVVAGKSSTPTVEVLDFQGPDERISITIAPMSKDGSDESVITVVVEKPQKQKGT